MYCPADLRDTSGHHFTGNKAIGSAFENTQKKKTKLLFENQQTTANLQAHNMLHFRENVFLIHVGMCFSGAGVGNLLEMKCHIFIFLTQRKTVTVKTLVVYINDLHRG